MKHGSVALCVAAAVLFVSGTHADAHTTTTPTEVRIVHEEVFEPPTHSVLGDLGATPPKCRDDRRVRLSFDYSHEPIEWVQVDVARSGLNGNWAGSGFMNDQFGFVSWIKAKVSRKNIGPSGHRHMCEGGVSTLSTGTG